MKTAVFIGICVLLSAFIVSSQLETINLSYANSTINKTTYQDGKTTVSREAIDGLTRAEILTIVKRDIDSKYNDTDDWEVSDVQYFTQRDEVEIYWNVFHTTKEQVRIIDEEEFGLIR